MLVRLLVLRCSLQPCHRHQVRAAAEGAFTDNSSFRNKRSRSRGFLRKPHIQSPRKIALLL